MTESSEFVLRAALLRIRNDASLRAQYALERGPIELVDVLPEPELTVELAAKYTQ